MGRYISAILFSVLLFFAVSTVNASITSWTCGDDGDHAIVMSSPTWAEVDEEYQLSMNCTQNWFPGHLQGDFITDTPTDPTVRILEDISNDTTFAWTDYHITIGMTQSFSILSTGLTAPAGWAASVIAPVAGILPNTNNVAGYVGTINYVNATGSPIAIGYDDIFGFKISFLGSTNFTTQQVPTPEPATIGLLGLGAMALLRRRKA